MEYCGKDIYWGLTIARTCRLNSGRGTVRLFNPAGKVARKLEYEISPSGSASEIHLPSFYALCHALLTLVRICKGFASIKIPVLHVCSVWMAWYVDSYHGAVICWAPKCMAWGMGKKRQSWGGNGLIVKGWPRFQYWSGVLRVHEHTIGSTWGLEVVKSKLGVLISDKAARPAWKANLWYGYIFGSNHSKDIWPHSKQNYQQVVLAGWPNKILCVIKLNHPHLILTWIWCYLPMPPHTSEIYNNLPSFNFHS